MSRLRQAFGTCVFGKQTPTVAKITQIIQFNKSQCPGSRKSWRVRTSYPKLLGPNTLEFTTFQTQGKIQRVARYLPYASHVAWGAAPHIIPVSAGSMGTDNQVQQEPASPGAGHGMLPARQDTCHFQSILEIQTQGWRMTVLLKFRPPFILPNIYYKMFKSTAVL